MNLNDTKVVVAIENAVCDQLEASGIKADPFRLDGEKIVQVILEQLGDYVVVPKGFVLVEKKILLEGVNKIEQLFEDDPLLALSELLPIQQGLKAIIEAQEQTND